MFTKATALKCAALGNGVRVTPLHPERIATPLPAPAYADPDVAKHSLADVPVDRISLADEIANVVLFLASEHSRYMTGAELVIDGAAPRHERCRKPQEESH